MNIAQSTTVYGIAAIVSAISGALLLLFDGNPATNPDYNAVIVAIIAGVGLIFSRSQVDHQKYVDSLPKETGDGAPKA